MKALVVYFSRVGENSVNGRIEIIKKGFTEILAEKIASLTGSAMYKIEPKETYPFSYEECVKRSRKEDETGEYVPYFVEQGFKKFIKQDNNILYYKKELKTEK